MSAVVQSIRRMGKDRWVHFTAVLFLLLLVVMARAPAGSGWGDFLAYQVVPVIWLIAALASRRGIERDAAEQGFWYSLGLGLLSWLAVRLLFLLIPAPRPLLVSIIADVLYVGIYVAIILAVEDRPDREPARSPTEVRLPGWPAVLLFVLGLLGYFSILPAIVNRDEYLLSSTALLLYVALDGFLVVRLTLCWVGARTQRWRAIYLGLWVVVVLLFATDLLEALIIGERVPWPGFLALELLWALPLVALILTARLAKAWPTDDRVRLVRRGVQRVFPREQLVAFSVILPVIHLAGYRSGLFDEASRMARDDLVLVWLVALGSLGIVQYRKVALQGERFAEVSVTQQAELARQEERLVQFNKRREVEEALRLSEEKFSKAFRAGPDPLLITTVENGLYVEVNSGFEALMGWTREEVIGRSTLDPSVWTRPEDRQRFVAEIQAKGRVQGFEAEVIAKDGELRNVEISAEPIEIGGAACLLSVVRDATEAKRLERQALRAQRMDSIGTLAGGLAHDLNNLLTPILMSIQLLQRKVEATELQALLETLESNAERASGVVRQVLTFARGVEGERLILDPRMILAEIESIVRETFPRTLGIEFEIAEDLLLLRGDATQLHQVLLNLCLNARDATPADGHLKVTATNRIVPPRGDPSQPDALPGQYVVFAVEDDGEGIPEALGERIFEPFFTTKALGEGTGLGLSTVAAIVESHGGVLGWESEAGEGARFSVWLPAAEATSKDTLPAVEFSVPQGQGELILLIDDEPSVLDVAAQILRFHGYSVVTAGDGAEGLEKFEAERDSVRAVVMDMMMPVLDGPATAVALHRLEPELPIIGMSGLVSEFDHSVRDHLVDFIAKPFTASVLLRALSSALN